ncbi:hypothetical protein Tsubulata_020069 [Turnera subulata]|uniref:Protein DETOXIFICATION n=1 Tax=Turnera subulata TaxID=218843 RepID=A0A9Q0GF68_9ROSI|nr:hypothetical protein Tsubulata_020069 [Turnera subulata]
MTPVIYSTDFGENAPNEITEKGEQEASSFELPEVSEESNRVESKKGFTKQEIVAEIKQQLVLAGPLVCVNFFSYFLLVISIAFVGHLGVLPLAGASIATAFTSMLGLTLLKGIGSALETFCGQSYGAKQYHMLGIHLQRGIVVLLLICIPISIILANADRILKFCRQDSQISDEAGQYARFLIPGIFGFALQECHVRFLQTQKQVVPMMISSGSTTLLHVLLCWMLVLKFGLGLKGAALANSISNWINALLLIAYSWLSPSCKETRAGCSSKALHGIPGFLKLAIPSAVMLGMEMWSFAIITLLSGLLPNPKFESSVFSISENMFTVAYTIPLGFSGAISTRVSNELGAGRPQAALLAVRVVVSLVIIEGIITATVLISGRNFWPRLYSKEKGVVEHVGKMLFLLAISHFMDGIQSVLSGTCRGCGWQKIGAFANLGAYYIIGIPSAVVLAFIFHIGGKGFWIGIMIALSVQATLLGVVTFFTDWDKQARKAKDRIKDTTIQKDS